MSLASLPLALTAGDPAGIGPDITLFAFAARADKDVPPFVLLADIGVLRARAEVLGLSVPIVSVKTASEAVQVFKNAMPVLEVKAPGRVVAGVPSVEPMSAVQHSIETAVALVKNGEASAIVTNPVSKSLLYEAGFEFPGHTEYLAALAGDDGQQVRSVMLLAAGSFKVVPATVHIPLKDVAPALTRDLLVETITITHTDLRRFFGYDRPRIAVSGLNPHAGEEGRLGREEADLIAPAIETVRSLGVDASGPYPADTLFHEGARERYDVAICMYHDQALVPFKALAFDIGVNVTLGLPFVRTSPDHGTAFDIAGTGKASPSSLIEALRLADAMTKPSAGRTGE